MNDIDYSWEGDYKSEIIHTLKRFQFATREQLCKLFLSAYQVNAANILCELIDDGYIGVRYFNIPAAGEHKPRRGQKTVRVTVCFLTEKEQNFHNSCPTRRSYGPAARIHSRMYHELNVLETYLWFRSRFDVEAYTLEDELRNFGGGTVPDLRVYFDGTSQDCEVVVQNSRSDLEHKSKDLWWFTPSLRQADVIENINDAIVHILDPIVPTVKKFNADAGKYTPIQERILWYLNAFHLPISAPALAKILDYNRGDVSGSLADLERRGLIFSTQISDNPGLSLGRPRKFYAAKEITDRSYDRRQRIVDASCLVIALYPIEENRLMSMFAY